MKSSRFTHAFVSWWPLIALSQATPSQPAALSIPVYPQVNRAPDSQVAPAWPQRPPGGAWGQVPGVAVDRHDNVWIHTRTRPVGVQGPGSNTPG